MNTPLLSICLITYNHATYIRQAIEGALMQNVNFEHELIIADDFSTDGTREILLEYKKMHPGFIRLILQEKNVGAARNWMDLISSPKSRYIAYFEGDDYWTDPLKLQKQVDYLERHPTCGLTIHNVKKMDLNGGTTIFNTYDKDQTLDFRRLLKFDFGIPSCSWVWRNNFKIPGWILQCKAGDWPLLFVLLKDSDCYYFADIMGVYRKHIGGVSTQINSSNYNLVHIQALEMFDKYERHSKKKEVNRGLSILYLRAFIYERLKNKFKINYLFRSIFFDPVTIFMARKKTSLFWMFPGKLRDIIR